MTEAVRKRGAAPGGRSIAADRSPELPEAQGLRTDSATGHSANCPRAGLSFVIAPDGVVPIAHHFAPRHSNVTSPLRGAPAGLWRSVDLIATALLLVGVMTLMDRESPPTDLDALLERFGPQRVLVVALFLLAWGGLCTWLGLYDERRLAQGGDGGRIVGACILGPP